VHPGFEGGQMPLIRRIPKHGFHNPFRQSYVVVNLGQLEIFASASEVTPELMLERRLIRRKGEPVKVLADGALTKPLTVKAHAFSSKAKEKLEALGGKAELITEGATKAAVGK
jgi:large subunit ribosomal protein L15